MDSPFCTNFASKFCKMRIQSNRLKDILAFAKAELAPFYPEREIQSFFYLLCEAYLGMNKTAVILDLDKPVSESELLKFNFAIKDLKKEKPIQYILGETEFCDLKFKVNEFTLIPRPETEELVYWIVEKKKDKQPLRILDIGTGSGCIAISLAKNLPLATVQGIDISIEALKIAQENGRLLKTRVDFFILDILNPAPSFSSELDLIVSNPPYVLESEKCFMRKNVLDYEPNRALFVKDSNPLLFYLKIVEFAKSHLVENGNIYFEINESKSEELSQLLQANGYEQIEIRKDISGKARMMCAQKKHSPNPSDSGYAIH